MIDLLITAGLFALAVAGYRRGAIVNLAGLAVLAGSAACGVLLGLALAGRTLAVVFGIAFAVAGSVMFTFKLDELGEWVDDRVSEMWRQLDRPLGAVGNALLGLALVWMLSAAMSFVPGAGGLGGAIRDSTIGEMVRGVVDPTGDVAVLLLRSGVVPGLRGPVVIAEEPDATVLQDPDVLRAAESVVKVQGAACREVTTGTGWVVAPRLVVTNAHVVAGHERTTVHGPASSAQHAATVVAFDPSEDLALLSVPTLALPPLARRQTPPKHGEPAAVAGFPRRLERTLYPARFDRIVDYPVLDIYGQRGAARTIMVFRGEVHEGNSGSPIIAPDGSVLGTVSAAAISQALEGGYAVPDTALGSLLMRLQPRVSTGPCLRASGPREL